MPARHTRLDTEPQYISFCFYRPADDRRGQFFLKFTQLVWPHHVEIQDSFSRADVFSLNVEVRLPGDFVVRPCHLEKFVGSQRMTAAKYQAVDIAPLPDRETPEEKLCVSRYQFAVIINSHAMNVVRVVRPFNLLFDGRMISEAMQGLRGQEEDKIRGLETDELFEHIIRDFVDPVLIDD